MKKIKPQDFLDLLNEIAEQNLKKRDAKAEKKLRTNLNKLKKQHESKLLREIENAPTIDYSSLE